MSGPRSWTDEEVVARAMDVLGTDRGFLLGPRGMWPEDAVLRDEHVFIARKIGEWPGAVLAVCVDEWWLVVPSAAGPLALPVWGERVVARDEADARVSEE